MGDRAVTGGGDRLGLDLALTSDGLLRADVVDLFVLGARLKRPAAQHSIPYVALEQPDEQEGSEGGERGTQPPR